MLNSDVLRSLRYTFHINDEQMIEILESVGRAATREEVCSWLKREGDPGFKQCMDHDMRSCLDGLISRLRGKQEQAAYETVQMSNNLILRKMKIALNLKSEDLISILQSTDIKISKHELSAFFRHEDHKHYRECKDQFMRNFLKGLQLRYRPDTKNNDPTK